MIPPSADTEPGETASLGSRPPSAAGSPPRAQTLNPIRRAPPLAGRRPRPSPQVGHGDAGRRGEGGEGPPREGPRRRRRRRRRGGRRPDLPDRRRARVERRAEPGREDRPLRGHLAPRARRHGGRLPREGRPQRRGAGHEGLSGGDRPGAEKRRARFLREVRAVQKPTIRTSSRSARTAAPVRSTSTSWTSSRARTSRRRSRRRSSTLRSASRSSRGSAAPWRTRTSAASSTAT